MASYKDIPVTPRFPAGFDHAKFRAAADEAMGHVERWGVTVRQFTHDEVGVQAHTLSGARVQVRY